MCAQITEEELDRIYESEGGTRFGFAPPHFTASKDILPNVNWLILGTKLPG